MILYGRFSSKVIRCNLFNLKLNIRDIVDVRFPSKTIFGFTLPRFSNTTSSSFSRRSQDFSLKDKYKYETILIRNTCGNIFVVLIRTSNFRLKKIKCHALDFTRIRTSRFIVTSIFRSTDLTWLSNTEKPSTASH